MPQFSAVCNRSTWQDLLSATLLNPVRDSFFATGTGVLHVASRRFQKFRSFPPANLFRCRADEAVHALLGCIKLQMPRSKEPMRIIRISKCVALALEYCHKICWLKISKALESLEGMSRLLNQDQAHIPMIIFLRFRTLLSRCGGRMCGRACTLKVCSPHCKLQAM